MTFEVRNGGFGYAPDRPLLKNVNLRLSDGEILCVLGANGAGKTTLMRCMLGLERWTEGASLIDGADIRGMKGAELWRRIACVPQARPSAFAYTALEMVLLGRGARLRLMQQPGPKDLAVAKECLRAVGMEGLSNRLLSKVSGGELQLILIARALAAEPRLMALDEPESHLDFRNQLRVLETIRRLREERGLSFIVNTHRPEHALALADRALLLTGGGTSLYGDAATVLTEANLSRAFGVDARIRNVEIDGVIYPCVLPLRARDD